MQDTRETCYSINDDKTKENTSPRFKPGDKLLIPHNDEIIPQVPHTIFWDKEFHGWLVCCNAIGVHEQNYILESEKDNWIPHEDGLWSWWEKK